MITSFKGFCSQAAKGASVQALYITPNAKTRDQQQLAMFNEASARGLCPILRSMDRTLILGDSVAVLRIAHPFLDRELRAMEWDFIHGLESVVELEDGERIAEALQARVRR